MDVLLGSIRHNGLVRAVGRSGTGLDAVAAGAAGCSSPAAHRSFSAREEGARLWLRAWTSSAIAWGELAPDLATGVIHRVHVGVDRALLDQPDEAGQVAPPIIVVPSSVRVCTSAATMSPSTTPGDSGHRRAVAPAGTFHDAAVVARVGDVQVRLRHVASTKDFRLIILADVTRACCNLACESGVC
jgi:hypothetical protein